jgi:DNA-binding NarL/FixJ family response regulator
MGRILLFERSTVFKDTLLQIIEGRFPDVVTKLVLSNEECLTEMKNITPDILFLGFSDQSGIELGFLEQVRERFPGVSIVLFTDYDIDEYRKDAILRGANHIISKESWTGDEILALINTILKTRESKIHIEAEGSSVKIKKDVLREPPEKIPGKKILSGNT